MAKQENQYSLKLSTKKVGRLVPILKDARGNVIDGKHRQDADANWPSITLENITDDLELTLARLIANVCRRNVEAEEKNELLGKIKELKPEWTVHDIAEALGHGEEWVREYLPDKYKDKKMQEVRTHRESQDNVSQPLTLSHDSIETPEATKETIAKLSACDLCGITSSTNVRWNNKVNVCPVCLEKLQHPKQVECDRCHVSTSAPVEWHNHQLCSNCHAKAEADPETFNGYFTTVNKKPQPQVALTTDTPRSLDSWEVRKAQMSPQHSKMEGSVIASLIESGVTGIVQGRHFCVLETIPDIFLPSQNTVIYLDGEAVHSGKQLDRDEQLRDLLKKRTGLKVLSYSYDSNSQKEVERVTKEILSVVKVEA